MTVNKMERHLNHCKLEFKFTRDFSCIKEFIELRRKLYVEDRRFLGFRHTIAGKTEQEDYCEKGKRLLAVMHDGRCVGGTILTICEPGSKLRLPLEEDFSTGTNSGKIFLCKNHFPEYDLEHNSYGEFTSIVISPEYRNGEVIKEIFSMILADVYDKNVKYLFGVGDMVRSRLYKMLYSSYGLEVKIHNNIELPKKDAFEGVKFYLMSMKIDDNLKKVNHIKVGKEVA